MNKVKNLLAKGVMSISGIGGDEGRETMTLKESLVQGVEG